ncbi:MAG TPA: DNA polymerase III subunit chi [Steroidobacteraceae bacterium]|jgi:DNA polymerase-3 subunit chi|nr:DNA polymerase III subunit chi [Steroidobacteraceae bacterium]
MGDSDGTSGSAASSGADSSRPGSFADEALRVDFYVIEGTAPGGRLKVACRLAEKAYLASQRALIWHTDRTELEALDELLWTFADGSFVPHEWLTSNGAAEAPVLLSAGSVPAETFDFVINLAAEPPPFLPLARRIAEIVDGDEGRRRAGRVRFKAYRELGIGPATHTLRAE